MTEETQHLGWTDIREAVDRLAKRNMRQAYRRWGLTGVWGIPRGGSTVAAMVADAMALPLLDEPEAGCLIVDDLVDSGATARYVIEANDDITFDALFRKTYSPDDLAPDAVEVNGWVTFPWDVHTDAQGPTDAVRRLLEHIGEDPNREGLLDTPKRVVKALKELTSGYSMDPAEILATTFDETYDSMVVVSNIEFSSMCEHHMLPFVGHATVAYIPSGGVVGLSKIARLVEGFAQRLQVQERLTEQIADAIEEHLQPLGVGVVITSHHSCMGMRGIRKARAQMTTSALRGTMLYEPETRAEFLSHHKD